MSHTLPEFLAHALAMENEAAERYLELADMMESHGKADVASLFRDMHRFSIMHRDSIQQRTSAIEVPTLRHQDFRWIYPPEVGDEDGFDPTMKPFDALQYARTNEVRAMEYYQAVARSDSDLATRDLAAEFADEEQGHARELDQWVERTPPS